MRIASTIAIAALAIGSLTACAPSPLIGRWSATSSAGGAQLTSVEAFNADGTAYVTLTGNNGCTGTLTYSGLTWTADATHITYGGHAMCSGEVDCTIGTSTVVIDCVHAPNGPQDGECSYMFSADGNSLTISNCSGSTGGSTTYTRVPPPPNEG